jgi:hypothetical protein
VTGPLRPDCDRHRQPEHEVVADIKLAPLSEPSTPTLLA